MTGFGQGVSEVHPFYDTRKVKNKAKKRARKNRVSGFNIGMNALINMAEAMASLDRGVSGTEETHGGGYADAASRSLDALRKIKAKGIKD